MVLSTVFAGNAQAKKKNKKKTHPQHAKAAPGTTFQQPPSNVYLGESVARAWGSNNWGQLGNAGEQGPTPPGTPANSSNTPVQVSNLSGIKAIDPGRSHSLALKEDGTV
jgi:hypothetical protein